MKISKPRTVLRTHQQALMYRRNHRLQACAFYQAIVQQSAVL